MFNRFTSYFIPADKQADAKTFRRYKLIANIIIITALFELNYAGISLLIGLREGAAVLLLSFFIHALLLFAIKSNWRIIVITHLFLFTGVNGVMVCIYFTGGFNSPVLTWLATTPIVALLMAGWSTGLTWAMINTLFVIAFSVLGGYNYTFPVHYNTEWADFLSMNCYAGIVLIIFFIALVFENGKNTALRKLEESSMLLAEEKKKTALHYVSQEIHDNIGAMLSVVKLNLHNIKKEGNDALKLKVEDTTAMLTKVISDLREISHKLYADNVINFNLAEAIQNELNLLSKIGAYITGFKLTGLVYPLNAETEIMLFRIAQEAINNIIKHAQAKTIDISMHYEHQYLIIKIFDDGVGFNTKNTMLSGQGLRNMHERIEKIAAKLNIITSPGNGTLINITLPLNKKTLND